MIPARGLVLFYRTGARKVVDYPAHYEDEGVTIAQHDRDNVRLTSFFELGGFDPRFSRARTDWLFEGATSHLSRSHRLELSETGVGYRPCTPDQLPLVGRIPRCGNVLHPHRLVQEGDGARPRPGEAPDGLRYRLERHRRPAASGVGSEEIRVKSTPAPTHTPSGAPLTSRTSHVNWNQECLVCFRAEGLTRLADFSRTEIRFLVRTPRPDS